MDRRVWKAEVMGFRVFGTVATMTAVAFALPRGAHEAPWAVAGLLCAASILGTLAGDVIHAGLLRLRAAAVAVAAEEDENS